MKKAFIASSCAIVLSLSLASAMFAQVLVMTRELDNQLGARTKCATEISPKGNSVMKCMPGGGCEWTDGSAVTYGGKC